MQSFLLFSFVKLHISVEQNIREMFFLVAQDGKITIKSEKSLFKGCRALAIQHTLNTDPRICK